MNWVDVLILATLGWFVFAGFHAGLIREAVTIIGAVFAVALAGTFYKELATDIEVAISDDQTAEIVAFGVIFGATVLASQLLALFLKQASNLLFLGLFDSMGGAGIGFVKAFVFVEIALIAGITFESLGVAKVINDSILSGFFLNLLPVLKHILPGEFKTAIESFN